MIDVETARWGMAGAVVATGLFAWALGGWLRACGFRPFRDAARLVPRSAVERVLLLCVAFGLVRFGGAKNGGTNEPPRRSAPAPLFGCAVVATNGTWDFSAPPGAAVHGRWRLRGAADDRFPLSPDGWTFALGDACVTNLTVLSSGSVRLPGGSEISPLPAPLGVVPEINWHVLEGSNAPSLFWHKVADDGSLLLTWQNVLLRRDAESPVSLQAELRPSGGVEFRYGLSRLASDAPLAGVVPSAAGIVADVPLSRGVTGVSFRSRDEGVCDAWRAEFEASLCGLAPLSFPEGSTNTVLEHLFYTGTTNGPFSPPQPSGAWAVLRVSVSGQGSGDLLVGGSYVPLVGAPPTRGGSAPQGVGLGLHVAKGGTVPVYMRGDGTLSVSFDSGEFAFGELPDLSANRHVGWINFPDTRASEPCVHDFATRRRGVSLSASDGADGLLCEWSGSQDVQVENHPPRSATVRALFDARETRPVSYTLSHPKRLFGQTTYQQTVRFCPRPPEPEEPGEGDADPPWYDGSYDDGGEWEEPETGEGGDDGGDGPETPDGEGDADEVCPVHEVPYPQCAHLHAQDYTNAVVHVQHMGGVLYIRDQPEVGEQIWLQVPDEHHDCCPCPEHQTNYVAVACRSHCLRVTDAGGAEFESSGESCMVDVAGVAPSACAGGASLAFARNGEVYEIRDYTVLGVAIRHGGVPLAEYNSLNPVFGFPVAVCTNAWHAPELDLVTDVGLSNGTVHVELVGATSPFALWYGRRGENGWRRLLDSAECPAKDIPIADWRRVVAGVPEGCAASVPVRVTSSAPGTARLVLRYWSAAGGRFVEDEAVQRITSVGPPLLPDLDRDGGIGDADLAPYLAGRAFRFWTNEDVHKGDCVGQCSNLAPNASDLVVNGRLDLVNLFPVKLDLKPFIDAWGSGVRFVLWSPTGNALRFCGLDAQPSAAWAFQTNDVCAVDGGPVHSAGLVPVGGEGVEIDPDDFLGAGNAPGVLAFEAAGEVVRSDALSLLVMDGDDTLFSCGIPLDIGSVHDMYSWIGARHLSGEADYRSSVVHRIWEGESVKSLIFFHGANVSGAEAQEWADAVFKRLWLSGAKMEFYNVDWRSDIGSDANYHQNASNSFVVASQLASTIAAIPGEKVVMAHSLGNMVVSSMIQDHGLAPSCYLMCNSAVPAEAYDTDLSLRVPQLVHPDWEEYPTNSWASSWHWLFRNDPNDDRRLLGWPGRFSNVAQYAVNFYSTGDEVLELAAVNNLWPATGVCGDDTVEHLSWHKQELFKGRGIGVGMGATDWSGWNIEENWLGVNKISVAEALQMSEEDFKTNTVFYCYPSSMNSTNISLLVRGAHLALGIPALTSATGRCDLQNVLDDGRYFDLNNTQSQDGVVRPNSWPELTDYPSRWRHSDMKNVAYFFNFKFYDKVIEKGNLK